MHVDDVLGPAEHVGNDDRHRRSRGRIEEADLDAHAPPPKLLAKRRFGTEALCRALAADAGENGARGGVGGCAHKGCVPRRGDRVVVRRVNQHRGNELRRGSVEGTQRLLGALGTLVGFIEKRVPRLLVKASPRGETPSGTRRAGRLIENDRPRLALENAQAPRLLVFAARLCERVDEAEALPRSLAPFRIREKRRRIRAQKRHRVRRVAAEVGSVVQGRTGKIDRHRRLPLVDAHVDGDIGVRDVHVGPLTANLAQTIADRILHAHARELRVAKPLVRPAGAHGDALAGKQDVLPRQRINPLVERIRVRCTNAPLNAEHARRQPRPKTCAQGGLRSAEKRHAAAKRARAAESKRMQLIGEQAFQPGKAACEELEFFGGMVGHIGSFPVGWVSDSTRKPLVAPASHKAPEALSAQGTASKQSGR